MEKEEIDSARAEEIDEVDYETSEASDIKS